jgi:hypothetical protein
MFWNARLCLRVSIIRIFIRIFFLENYSLFEYFLTEYSNNTFLLNKPYKNVKFQTIFPKKLQKKSKIQFVDPFECKPTLKHVVVHS